MFYFDSFFMPAVCAAAKNLEAREEKPVSGFCYAYACFNVFWQASYSVAGVFFVRGCGFTLEVIFFGLL